MSPKNAASKAEEVVENPAVESGAISDESVEKVKLELVDADASDAEISDQGISDAGISDQAMVDQLISGGPISDAPISDAPMPSMAQQPISTVQTAKFAQLGEGPVSMDQNSMDLLLDVDLDLSVELGRAAVPVREILHLGSGSIVELTKLAGDSVDVLVNGRLIARGEVVVVDENFGVRITEILSPTDRISRLG
jgi:flagellar motor switch protein FliN